MLIGFQPDTPSASHNPSPVLPTSSTDESHGKSFTLKNVAAATFFKVNDLPWDSSVDDVGNTGDGLWDADGVSGWKPINNGSNTQYYNTFGYFNDGKEIPLSAIVIGETVSNPVDLLSRGRWDTAPSAAGQDYITIERGAEDQNPWSRTNGWANKNTLTDFKSVTQVVKIYHNWDDDEGTGYDDIYWDESYRVTCLLYTSPSPRDP